MNFEDALRIADEAVMRLKKRHLNNAERIVLQGSWDDLSYEKIAEQTEGRLGERYLKQDVGHKLWSLLSEAIGEKIGKKTFRTVFEVKFSQQSSTVSSSSLPQSSVSLSQSDSIRNTILASSSLLVDDPPNWDELFVDISRFCGRGRELAQLEALLREEQCRLIVLHGMKGSGKTALSQTLRTRVQSRFTQTICLSLSHAPSATDLLRKLLQSLTELGEDIPSTFHGRLSYLIQYFRQNACLVILDQSEAIFQAGTWAGRYRAGYEDYRDLLRRVAETIHQSCLVWVSQEEPEDFPMLRGYGAQSFPLSGLSLEDGQNLLQSRLGFPDLGIDWANLVRRCSGNPLALVIICNDIEVFGEEIEAHWTGIIEQIQDPFDKQFKRLSQDETEIMYWLAIAQHPLTLAELQAPLVSSEPNLGRIIQSLRRRSLCLQVQSPSSGVYRFTLCPIVEDYVLQQFLQHLMEEIQTDNLSLLNSYALFMADTPEYVRVNQLRGLFLPFVERFRAAYPSRASLNQQIKGLLLKIRSQDISKAGYAVGNLINLCQHLNLDLTDGYDFSGLTIRQADLWNVHLHNSNFARANLSQSRFASPLGSSISLAFSPNGKWLATGDEDGRVLLWQIDTGQLQLICQNPERSPVLSLVFSPDGNTLAGTTEDQLIKLWDIRTGQQWNHLAGHSDPVQCVCFSPDGRTLASASYQTICLWDSYSGRCYQTIQWDQEVIALSFGLDGKQLVSCGSQSIYRWDVSNGQPLQTRSSSPNSWFEAIFFQPIKQSGSALTDSQRLIVAELDDRAIKLWHVESGEHYGSFFLEQSPDYSEAAVEIAFSGDGLRMASGIRTTQLDASGGIYYSHCVKVWDIPTKQCIQILQGITSQVHSLAFTVDGQLLATSGDRQIQLWSVQSGQCLRAMQDCRKPVCAFTLNHDGTRLITGNQDHSIRVWEIQSGQRAQTLMEHTNWVDVLAVSPDGQLLASSSYDKSVRLWDLQTGQSIRTFGGHTDRIRVLCFSPTQSWLASGSNDQTVKLWDLKTGTCLGMVARHDGSIYSLCASSDGKFLGSGSSDGMIQILSLNNKQLVQQCKGHTGRVHLLSFSLDGQRLVSGSHDERVRVWDVATGDCLSEWSPFPKRVHAVVFDPTNRAIASISDITNTHVIEIWDVQANQRLQTLEWKQPSKVWEIHFGLDRELLASGTHDGMIRVWRWETGKCLRVLRAASPYEGMNIRDAQGISEPQKLMLAELGAIEH